MVSYCLLFSLLCGGNSDPDQIYASSGSIRYSVHDVGYHLLRTEALKQRIEDMNFFNGGIDYLFYNGAGYASSLAYPDLLLYIPALLRTAGVGIGLSMSIF